MRRELTISRLGNQADGVADTNEGPIYLPFALPGERVVAEVIGNKGHVVEILGASSERREPDCLYFASCGGCAIQHLEWGRYLDWKRQLVLDALSMEGIEAQVDRVVAFGPRSRRRATFTFQKTSAGSLLGFRRALSHELIDIRSCPVVVNAIEAALPSLRDLLDRIITSGAARVLVTSCENGLDINIDEATAPPRPVTSRLSQIADAARILRVTIDGVPHLSLGAPQISFSGTTVDLPPGAFLQACADAEAAMTAFALNAVGKAKTVADLYCGLGAFTFALARKAKVTAVELDRALIANLETAAKRTPGLKPIGAMRRDLARDPLSWMELKGFDAVVFDPPRAGAIEQAKAIAKSRVAKVVAISCNPVSFARDARELIKGGYKMGPLLPIDQFVYSPHVELAAAFER